MKIIVLNGSPKGDVSVTMQYVLYIQKRFPQHDLEIINISQRIRKIVADESLFQSILDRVEAADAVLWAYPLYTLLVHSHYKRFIELIFERGVEERFAGKYAAILTTSIHFFDHTAHNYVHGICDDLGMKMAGTFSPGMNDLLKEEGREKLALFAEQFFGAIESGSPAQRIFAPITWRNFQYEPGDVDQMVDTAGKKVLVITDATPEDSNLAGMVERFSASFDQEIEVINLHEVDIKGGCLGCIHCGYDNICTYADKDGFTEFWNTKVREADILVFAGTIHDRYLSSLWKTFFDRRFFNTHTPTLIGKQLAIIISGPFSQLLNLQEVLDGFSQMEMMNLAGFVTDEYGDSAHIDGLLGEMASRLVSLAVSEYVRPRTFLGVAGMKLFRDEVWSGLRTVFRADHRAYKRLGIYDFPQKQIGVRLLNAVMAPLLLIPAFRKGMQRALRQGMLMRHRRILES